MLALSLLRKYTSLNLPYQLIHSEHPTTPVHSIKEATHIQFPEEKAQFSLSEQSSFKNYPIEAMVLFLQNKDLQFMEYFNICIANNVIQISLVDINKVTEYMTGKTDTLDSLQFIPKSGNVNRTV